MKYHTSEFISCRMERVFEQRLEQLNPLANPIHAEATRILAAASAKASEHETESAYVDAFELAIESAIEEACLKGAAAVPLIDFLVMIRDDGQE